MGRTIYKVLTGEEWAAAEAGGPVQAPVDVADGFVHFSTAAQLGETLARHFKGQAGCVLAAFEAEDFGPDLKWEKSRGGDLFAHVYGGVHAGQARSLWLLEMGPEGAPIPPDEVERSRDSGATAAPKPSPKPGEIS